MIGQLLSQGPAESAQAQSRAGAVEVGAADSRMGELGRGEFGARAHTSSRVSVAA